MKPFVLGAIFARGGSKGVPRKNIKLLNGKPLIAYAIEAARAVKGIDAVIVSTDDEEIAEVARKSGAEVPFMRPTHLAADDSPEVLAWAHAIEKYGQIKNRPVDVLVSVPTTSPLRDPADVERCLAALLGSDADAAVIVTQAERNPYFNMVKIDNTGYASVVIPPSLAVECRQVAPEVYDMTTVAYAVRADFIRQGKRLFEGKVKAVHVPKERALDIDTILDFELAEFLLKRKVR